MAMNHDKDSTAAADETSSDEAATKAPEPVNDVGQAARRLTVEGKAPRRSFLENWAAFSVPVGEQGEIHNAVSDALAEVVDTARPAIELADESGSGSLPPPPDRSGASFHVWDEKDDRPEFFHETVADETLGSSSDWRLRLGTAIAVDVDDEDDDDDELELPPPPPSAVVAGSLGDDEAGDDDEELRLGPDHEARSADDDELLTLGPVGDEARADEASAAANASSDEAASAAASALGEIADEDEDEAASASASAVGEIADEVEDDAPKGRATESGRWVARWTAELLAIPDEDEAASASRSGAVAEVADDEVSELDEDAPDEDEDDDAPRRRSRQPSMSITGEIVDDDDEEALASEAAEADEAAEAAALEGLDEAAEAEDAEDEAEEAAEGDASISLEEELVPRPRSVWIADESDPPESFYGDPFPLDRWQDPRSLVGRVIRGAYRLTEPVGRGDSFRVYLAEQIVTGEPLVIKLLGPDYPPSEERAALFRREAREMARLPHPKVVEVIDVGTTRDGLSYVALERLAGSSLASLLANQGPLAWEKATSIVRQVLEVTLALRDKGHVHRTIHPENVYVVGEVDGEPSVKLTNVGLTPLSTHYRRPDGNLAVTPEGLLGSAEYMAPEVVSGNLPDEHSDVYAAGILLYEVLVGKPPFLGESLIGLLKKHLYDEPPSLRAQVASGVELPDGIEAVILKALEKDPAQRHADVGELARELAAAEARQHEVARAKTLLSAVDAALWGDDEESMVELAERAGDAEEEPRDEPPISPLTDEDLSEEEKVEAVARRTAAMLKAVADTPTETAPVEEAAPATVLPTPQASGGEASMSRMVIGGVILAVAALVFFVIIRPGGEPVKPTQVAERGAGAGKVAGAGPEKTPEKTSEGPAEAGPEAGDPSGTPPTVGELTAGAVDPSEGAALDPSEGAALDPSEGAALDPSEGAALDPSEGDALDPSEGDALDPSDGGEAAVGGGEPAAIPDVLDDATIRSKLSGVRSRVSKQCGQTTGLFAPVGLTIKVRVEVDPSGRVKATPVNAGSKLGICAAGIVNRMRLPRSKKGGSTVHTFKL
ncbi:MAG: protein kinase [Myxococcales bacterium]|nr:protein kinase [Myxococcales bacterium]